MLMTHAKTAAEAKRSQMDQYTMVAYKIRVMLSHIRTKYDAQDTEEPPAELRAPFEIMKTKMPRDSAKKLRREQRRKVENPFLHFRSENNDAKGSDDDDDDDDGEAEKRAVVLKYFDGEKACALLDDGSTSHADWYAPSGSGFVRAFCAFGSTIS